MRNPIIESVHHKSKDCSKFAATQLSLVVDREFVDDIEVLDHDAEFIEGDLAIEVSVGLHNGPVDQLLKLNIIQVVTDHHLEHLEELAIRDESVVVDVVDLESETQLVLLRCTRGERVESLHEFKERNVSIVVPVEDGDDALNKRVVRKL